MTDESNAETVPGTWKTATDGMKDWQGSGRRHSESQRFIAEN